MTDLTTKILLLTIALALLFNAFTLRDIRNEVKTLDTGVRIIVENTSGQSVNGSSADVTTKMNAIARDLKELTSDLNSIASGICANDKIC